MIEQIIGNYKIEEKLGEGGMGAVYRGVDTMLDREVAIKALRPELASQTSVVERFRSEAVTLAKLNHPNIATLYSMFRQGDEIYMVLEFVRGETLDNILQRRGALPAEEAVPVFCQVLDGINHAHESGIVHRDIKPANMMLTEKGTLKVLDFGIARLLGSARMTRAGNIIGTLEYMAPEQVKGQETDARSDIYALGMMLYEVLTGRLPFDTENEFELMKMQTEDMPPAPREINPAIPEAVEEAIMRAIQKNPDERFQTAGEMLEQLIEAGFSAQGTMHGATGTFKKLNTHPSRPPVSQAGVSASGEAAEKTAVKETRLGTAASVSNAGAIKATRLGESVNTASTAGAMKATRLGTVEGGFAAAESEKANAAAGSFFANLKPFHYIGAGVAGLILLGLVILVPAMFLSGGEAEVKADDKKAAEEKNKIEEAQKPQVVEMPQQPAQIPPPAPATTTDPALPRDTTKGGELTPVEEKPAATEKPAAVAKKPAAPPPPAAKPKPAASKPAKKTNAECILTGNC